MLTEQIAALMQKPSSEIRALPRCSSTRIEDGEGRRFEIITWCDKMDAGTYRVVISSHRIYPFGISTVAGAEGFTIDVVGNIRRIDSSEARAVVR